MSVTQSKIHIVDKETGYCKTCQKFEKEPENKDLKSYLELFSRNSNFAATGRQTSELEKSEIWENNVDNNTEIKLIKYKRYKYFDCCKGKLAAKFKTCRLCEAFYYVPLWSLCLIILCLCGLIATTVYLAIYYPSKLQLQTYATTCNSSAPCDTDKGLYCRLSDGTSQDYCNCPAKSTANTCDCPSSYFWSGITCSAVYSYGEGTCMGDYACASGLTCDQSTGLCTCPDITPSWDSATRTCNYAYQGCFDSCFNTSSCDWYTNDIILTAPINSIYSIELDECLSLCNIAGFKYTHMHTATMYRCACSNTYKNFSVQLADSECSISCSLYKSSISKCPKSNRHSSFKLKT